MAWVRDALNLLDVKPSKRRGQNFLSSSHDARRLVFDANITKDDIVLEVGPGLGSLTEAILELGVKVHVVEIEEKFSNYLKEKFSKYGDLFSVHISDFREFEPSLILDSLGKNEDNDQKRFVLVSNVPYIFSTEMLLWIIKNRSYFKSSSLLFQKEFSERVIAKHGSKTYGSLSVLTQFYFELRNGIEISGDAFFPRAEILSKQIHLIPSSKNLDRIDNYDAFHEFVRACFSTRRKMLTNTLLNKGYFKNREEAEGILDNSNIPLKARAEDLDMEQFIKLYKILYGKSN
jgi:16S rRNA (adenine1518-N6/adenine1519-N6)-dimethyltransferase